MDLASNDTVNSGPGVDGVGAVKRDIEASKSRAGRGIGIGNDDFDKSGIDDAICCNAEGSCDDFGSGRR